MAEDAVNQAIQLANFPEKECVTENLKIHGFDEASNKFGDLAIYGTDAESIQKLIKENPDLAEKLHDDFSYCAAEIVWIARNEMAQTIEDMLARRTRALFLNARAAIEIAPKVGGIMAQELGKDEDWIKGQIETFNTTARNYVFNQENNV
jgi:glycerol-3-phosphate dehydrogenase